MLDIETLDTKDSAVVLTIAAVKFNILTYELVDKLILLLNVDSQLSYGRTISSSTILFHLENNLRIDILKNVLNPKYERLPNPAEKYVNNFHCLVRLDEFIEASETGVSPFIFWARGASFDFTILKNLYQNFGREYPISHRKEMCLRPLLLLSPETAKRTPDVGVAHEALSDCLYQICLLRNLLEDLNLLSRFSEGNLWPGGFEFLVFKIGERYWYNFSGNRTLTAWSLEGAGKFRFDQLDEVAKVEQQLKANKKNYVKEFIRLNLGNEESDV